MAKTQKTFGIILRGKFDERGLFTGAVQFIDKDDLVDDSKRLRFAKDSLYSRIIDNWCILAFNWGWELDIKFKKDTRMAKRALSEKPYWLAHDDPRERLDRLMLDSLGYYLQPNPF